MRRKTLIRCRIGRTNSRLYLTVKGTTADQILMAREIIKAVCDLSPEISPEIFIKGLSTGGVAKS